jgi:single-stranded-DNA-specific exonuclease
MNWELTETDEMLSADLADRLGVSVVCARLLVQRGLVDAESAEDFMRPRLARLDDPFSLTNLEDAVLRIEEAVARREDVVVFGDYDVDGITSTVQLVHMLRILGVDPRYCVPRRMEEGYGLSEEAIDRAFDAKFPQLFIALDCGTNAHEPVAYLRDKGIDVIIVDHHQAKEDPVSGCILVNPHIHDSEDAPWRNLCTAGLVFKLLHGLLKRFRAAEDERVRKVQLKDYLDLVALGTVADLVPLHQENRILSWYGLQHLRANGRVGIRALAEVSGIGSTQDMSSGDISFKLGPRINACGRLADAQRPIQMLLGEDYPDCLEIAQELDAMNKERQAIERGITLEAEARVEVEFGNQPGIVLFNENWHAGVVGIVASRVSRRFNKPTVILGAEGDMAHGSGRSVAEVNLVEVFQRCCHLLEHWGGHPMAAGVSMRAQNVEAFTACFTESLSTMYPDGLPEASLSLACWLELSDLSENLLEELTRLHPFGQGNSEPLFGLKSVRLQEPVQIFGRKNFRFRLPPVNGRAISGIAWGMGQAPKVGQAVDMALRFSWNYWRNSRYPQVTLVDWKPSSA